ncbi:MAG TPA: DUF6636 domain-containing protein [Gaiellaceae bacterium]|nr:DUF6636 domain-containing protein [Gaiellaceae bacterium]
MQNGYTIVKSLWLKGRRIRFYTDQEAPMKPSLLIFGAIAVVVAAVTASSSVAGGPGAKILPGFRSPSGNIKCYYNPKGLSARGFTPVLRCSLDHADYAKTLQRRCETGDWHGFTLTPTKKPLIFCPGGASGDHPVYRTLAYGMSWQRGPFICASRLTGVTCRNRTAHGLFISRQAYRSW